MSNELTEKFGKSYPANTVLFHEEEHGDCMYIIQQGEVAINKKSKNSEHILAILKAGDFFGEMALFTNPLRSATAITTKESVLLKIDKNALDYMLKSNPTFAMKMIERLCERLKNVDNQLSELIDLSQETKILRSLMKAWENLGIKDSTGKSMLVAYDSFNKILKEEYNYSDSSINKTLLAFKEKDLIQLKKDTGGRIYITLSPRIFQYFVHAL